MKRNLKQVRPEDFDAKALMVAAREGRLYVDEGWKEVSREDVKHEVRAYVGQIRKFVTEAFRSSIDDLWGQILSTEEFMVLLMPSSKAKKCQEFNKYNVMRIIGVLRENGVYEQYNDIQYDALLEPDVKDSPYRKFLSKGIDDRSLVLDIRDIVKSI